MINRLSALKNKKGFTLVEIIVVLVIIAVLAAAGIPSLIGFISDARGKTLVAEARATYTAAQAVITEAHVMNHSIGQWQPSGHFGSNPTAGNNAAYNNKLAGLLAPDLSVENINGITFGNGVVSQLIYVKNDYTVTIKPGEPASIVRNS
ncbi:MAG: prepilin-type N-terminal cleavage/methylation domain-containing protein [Oscillospiraceae bacterium]|nr:prepilin-type N-terminal cleavage/methylation domain-containing protein [Oscillospiraceae bacterium]